MPMKEPSNLVAAGISQILPSHGVLSKDQLVCQAATCALVTFT